MTDHARSPTLTAAVCLRCGKPLPEPRAKRRRYCSASCRTMAYNLRVVERLAPVRPARTAELPSWVSTPSGEVPVLSQTRAVLNEVGATLAALAHRAAAEESALRRDLDRVRARVSKHQRLERELVQAQQHLAARDAELRQLRQMLSARAPRPLHATDAQPTPPLWTVFPVPRVPDRLLDGVTLLTSQLDFVRGFARAQAQRGESEVVTGFAVGLDLIHARLCAARGKQDALGSSPAAVVLPAVLREALEQDLLPAFDDLFRCVRALRGAASSPQIDSLREAVEWVFACFVGVLEQQGASLLYPLGSPFDPHEHEAISVIETVAFPAGSNAEVIQVGVRLDGVLLRPARVAVVAAGPVAPST